MAFFQERVDKNCIGRLEKFVEASFERMEYTEAIMRLEKAVADGHKFQFPVKWGMDLQSEHERWLTEEHIGRPVVVVNYPKDIKAFYMRMNEDGKTVVTDGGSYSNNGVSAGFIRLQSPYNPKTHIMIGTCYGNPCLLNRVEKYIETIIPIDY